MKYKRSAGIILHPTSLPGPDGIGDLGPEAYQWIDTLAQTNCGLWQILPLGPTGYGDSPYQCFSAFAGNPYLVSPVLLLNEGLLIPSDLSDRPEFPPGSVQYGEVIKWKVLILKRACERFDQSAPANLKTAFDEFQDKEADWLKDYTTFMAIKDSCGGANWSNWPADLRQRDPKAIEIFKESRRGAIHQQELCQFFFFRQWLALRQYAASKDIRIIGDIPIFVAYDCADVWSHPDLYYLDEEGLPTVVAGVPPDYFSPTGQLWGNPLYRWDYHRSTGYAWWIQRIKSALNLYDILRIDHFRGFAGYWEVPAGMPTAEIGRWVPGPGNDLFEALQKALGDLPIIAEDLGVITPDVVELRDRFNFPGMKILQFAFSTTPSDPFLPHNYPVNCIAYTGTHDNDTTIGWYQTAPRIEQEFCRTYLQVDDEMLLPWDMIRALWASPAVFTLAPLQDVLCLDTTARMNFPGKSSGNWSWRLEPGGLGEQVLNRLKEMNRLYSRPFIPIKKGD